MRNRVDEIYKKVCVQKAKPHFVVLDREKGETVENFFSETKENDILILFVT